MFKLEDVDQRAHFFGWLQIAEECVRTSKPSPGQALVFAGPRNSGKNFIQDIITAILGGRAARPYPWFVGQTTFNADLFEAEHLMIADEVPFQYIKSRRVFGCKIKDVTVNSIHSCHGKHANAVIINSKELDPLHGQLLRIKESLLTPTVNICGYTPPDIAVVDYFF
ncbi:MAG: hypothetical protein VYE44_05725 [Verrucomicrobiota bacterium]|nr:hypothetical protein [Verrucomicrobiota bacterium]